MLADTAATTGAIFAPAPHFLVLTYAATTTFFASVPMALVLAHHLCPRLVGLLDYIRMQLQGGGLASGVACAGSTLFFFLVLPFGPLPSKTKNLSTRRALFSCPRQLTQS